MLIVVVAVLVLICGCFGVVVVLFSCVVLVDSWFFTVCGLLVDLVAGCACVFICFCVLGLCLVFVLVAMLIAVNSVVVCHFLI